MMNNWIRLIHTQLPGEYDLFDLMAQVTEENLHAPVDFGPPVGREAL